MASSPLAVIDIGSNSGRVVVVRRERERIVEVLADERAPLRLIQHLDRHGRLEAKAVEQVLHVLRDFKQIAVAARAGAVVTVATAAVRESGNAAELVDRINRELGLKVRILDPQSEAIRAFLGAVYGLPVEHGMVIDVGGGSLQACTFRNRRLRRWWSLSLGALRMSDRFLSKDLPTRGQIRRLRDHVLGTLAAARLPRLGRGEVLVGTGGTIRNLSKVDARRRGYPIPRLHGYEMTGRRLRDLSAILSALRASERAFLPGMNAERADSIAAGALIVETVMAEAGARSLLVSGQGLREGIVLEQLGTSLPPAHAVRARSVAGLISRFASWEKNRAARRSEIAENLYHLLEPEASSVLSEMLSHAALLLDIGRSIDHYRRHLHTATIVRSTDLLGFRHREIQMVAAMVELADDGDWNPRRYRPLLKEEDQRPVERAGLVLSLADRLERRLPPGKTVRGAWKLTRGSLILREPAFASWEPGKLGERFVQVFGKKLKSMPSTPGVSRSGS